MQNAIRHLNEALHEAAEKHAAGYDEREIRNIIDLLLDELCGISRTDRILCPDRMLTANQSRQLLAISDQLRRGIPVQQAMGYAWFGGVRFSVNSDVLIPRPETEELVDWIVSTSLVAPSPRILDVGTGSGCIALSLARRIPSAQVVAVDVSEAALRVAIDNSYQQGVENVQFVQCDILTDNEECFSQQVINNAVNTCQQLSTSMFEIIVSNPPYICNHEASEMTPTVLDHEPSLALFVPDEDPLLFYRTIAQYAVRHLAHGGYLFFEINAAYGHETVALLQSLGFSDVQLRQDVSGRDRMICATL